jgi:molecular chaperone DnaK
VAEIILGIDLGTSYSTAAAVIGGRLHFALDRGEACIPSVVHFPRTGRPVVGGEAEKLRAADAPNTVFGIKRLVGRPADSPSARLLDAAAAFRIKPAPGGGEAMVEVRSGQHAASEVAAILLRHLRELAEHRFGGRIGKAVLTVPVTATPAVRDAMVRCGKMAGLEVLRIVSEPCAGAVARFGAGDWGPKPILIYDFGGGTFDAAVVRRDGARLAVLASGGDDCLGGDDLDATFARWVASGVYRVQGVDITRDAILWDRVQRQCELVKRSLSASLEARYLVADAVNVGGRHRDLDVRVHREHLRPVWAELVRRSIDASLATLADAGLGPPPEGAGLQGLAGVLLVGGTTFVPQVREAVAQAFAVPSLAEEDPQTAVARGAAILATQPGLLEA